MNNIDITKKYQTSSGMQVRIYAVIEGQSWGVHGAIKHESGRWVSAEWHRTGEMGASPHELDLVPVKAWRAWKKGEAPKFFMAQTKTSTCAYVAPGTGPGFDGNFMLENYMRLHEDGTTTPCGVLE